MIADGNPAEVRSINSIGLQRRGFADEEIRSLKEAYKIIFLRKMTVSDALEELKNNSSDLANDHPVNILISFIESSERGIIR